MRLSEVRKDIRRLKRIEDIESYWVKFCESKALLYFSQVIRIATFYEFFNKFDELSLDEEFSLMCILNEVEFSREGGIDNLISYIKTYFIMER